jgi:hypothetical protein
MEFPPVAFKRQAALCARLTLGMMFDSMQTGSKAALAWIA